MATFRILGICGSLRQGSFNLGLLRAAAELAPDGVEVEIDAEGLREIPPFDEDVERRGQPAAVAALSGRIRAADALIVASPEYNYGVSGVLKNAIDWLSRPPAQTPLRFKPVALMGASGGNFGTVRAQMALRQTLLFLESHVLAKPEVLVFRAQERFDAQVRLVDEATRKQIAAQVAALVDWARKVAGPGADLLR